MHWEEEQKLWKFLQFGYLLNESKREKGEKEEEDEAQKCGVGREEGFRER